MTTEEHIHAIGRAPNLGALRSFYAQACLALVQEIAGNDCSDARSQALELRKAANKRLAELCQQAYLGMQLDQPF